MRSVISYCRAHLDAQPNHARNIIQPFRAFTISCVACILMHDRTKHGTLFNPFGYSRFLRGNSTSVRNKVRWFLRVFFVQQVARYGSVILYCSVHLDARMNHARNVIQPLSGIHDFVRSVQLVARPNHARNVIQPFRVFTISCNELHATGFTGVHYFKKVYVDYSELR